MKCIYCSAVIVNLNKPLLGVYVEISDYAFRVYYCTVYSNTMDLIPTVRYTLNALQTTLYKEKSVWQVLESDVNVSIEQLFRTFIYSHSIHIHSWNNVIYTISRQESKKTTVDLV